MTRAPRFPLALDRVGAAPRAKPAAELLRPQRPLQHAAQHAQQQAQHEAAGRSTPAGLGLDSAAMRARMVQRLRAEGLACEPVIVALGRVERHHFVDTALANQAYEDTSLPIGLAQTISKPSVVAHMLALLFEGAAARSQGHLGSVLEIGTGCGYQAALLAELARSVVSIERLKALHDKAAGHLAGVRKAGLRLVYGDGRLGHAPRAPYHSIIAAAGGDDVPQAWIDQLAVGGRLVAPTFDAASGGQLLVVIDRDATGLQRRRHDAVHFVPLKSGAA
ncbi:MAG: protein-L-isoaspartate O-methyltransferase [Burkholderiales bacterium]|nr:protein-L-isoaspartate O-methyltransferase [Burkholderiales bacterium]